ncbi:MULTISPECIES: N-acetylmuramoyl-L-alanine amidase [Paenibacillus]|nr:N-acetylmuramoyl-L-alanine amidase [Paenibacillus caseinilyticus]MCZ8523647.1 N-acetylmuramoyl-L-alanine amidase [Paenibacillus caseinilyticus]
MLTPEDAEKIIRFLSAAYYCTESEEARREFKRLANALRKASGQPEQ